MKTLILTLLLSVRWATADEVTLAWDPPPPGEAGDEAKYFLLRYGFAPGNYPFTTNVGNTTTGIVSNLEPGSNYFFVATAINRVGLESPPSKELAYQADAVKPPLVTVRPDPPNSMRIVRLASEPNLEDTVNIAWTTSTSSRALPDTEYVLYAATNTLSSANLTNALIRLTVGTNQTISLRQVTPGRWSFAVTAARGTLESYPANILAVEVSPAPPDKRTMIDAGPFRVLLP